MEEIYIQYKILPFGKIVLGAFQNQLCLVEYFNSKREIRNKIAQNLHAPIVEKETELLQETYTQIFEYWQGQRKSFVLPLRLFGTDFQKSIWKTLLEIPYGETTTYSSIARKIGNINAVRAVATAIAMNPISIIIPCHRVIKSNGEWGDYTGGKLIKQELLKMEYANLRKE